MSNHHIKKIMRGIHTGNLLFISSVLTLGFMKSTKFLNTLLPYTVLILVGYWGISYIGVLFSTRKKKSYKFGYGSLIFVFLIFPLLSALGIYIPYEIRMIVLVNILLLIGIKIWRYSYYKKHPDKQGDYKTNAPSILIELQDKPKNKTEILNLIEHYCMDNGLNYTIISDNNPLEVKINSVVHTSTLDMAYSPIGTPIYSLCLTPKL